MAREEFSEDIVFLIRLHAYLERRDVAIGLDEPSDATYSMQSYIVNLAATGIITESQRLGEAADLMDLITRNKEKAERLAKKVERSKSKRRIRTWYQIMIRLYNEAEEAEQRLKELENG